MKLGSHPLRSNAHRKEALTCMKSTKYNLTETIKPKDLAFTYT